MYSIIQVEIRHDDLSRGSWTAMYEQNQQQGHEGGRKECLLASAMLLLHFPLSVACASAGPSGRNSESGRPISLSPSPNHHTTLPLLLSQRNQALKGLLRHSFGDCYTFVCWRDTLLTLCLAQTLVTKAHSLFSILISTDYGIITNQGFFIHGTTQRHSRRRAI